MCWLSAPVRNYGDVFLQACGSQPFARNLGHKGLKILAGEGPLERRGGLLIVALEMKAGAVRDRPDRVKGKLSIDIVQAGCANSEAGEGRARCELSDRPGES